MGFRVIFLENEISIRLKLDNLLIQKEGKDIWIPLDDISMIVVDNLKISITARVYCSLAKHNIGLVICDQEHLPIYFLFSMSVDGYVFLDEQVIEGVNIINTVVFIMPELEFLENFIMHNYPRYVNIKSDELLEMLKS